MKKKVADKENRNILDAAVTGIDRESVSDTVNQYSSFYNEESGGTIDFRKSNYTKLVNHYYDLATDFYQYGWGDSFHFAPRLKNESFKSSLKRHELFLAQQMNLKPDEKILDVGCGIGGPIKTIAQETGSQITGINNNNYQIKKAKINIKKAGLESLCNFVKGDFMNIPFADGKFDAAYQIDATVYAPDRIKAFSEIFRVLKPGGLFSGYEWCLTELHDSSNPRHCQIKQQIEEGTALPNLPYISEVKEALKNAGFEILEVKDHALTGDANTPWYLPLTSREISLRGFARSRLGRTFTSTTIRFLELFRIAPQGATKVSSIINRGADALVASGELGTFTPLYFYLAKKPF